MQLPLQIQGSRASGSRAIALEQLRAWAWSGFEDKSLAALGRHAAARVDRARAVLRAAHPDDGRAFGALDEITRDRLNEQLQQLWARAAHGGVRHPLHRRGGLPDPRIVVMSPRPGRIVASSISPLPDARELGMRDDPDLFSQVAHRVREALAEGHHD